MQKELDRLIEQVKAARDTGTKLIIKGGNTKSFYGEPLPANQEHTQELNLSKYSGIISYEPSELVITVRAGTLLSEVEKTISEQGQMLAFEPPRFGPKSTMGGVIASGLSGPSRMAAGSANDFVLGTKLLDSNGNVMTFGGQVMKNVAGYDVSRLMAGSLGSLGPILELSIKVLPVPVKIQTQVLSDITQEQALYRLSQWRSLPFVISASTWVADEYNGNTGPESKGTLYVRLSGSKPAVHDASNIVGGNTMDDNTADAFWLSMRDQTHDFFKQDNLWRLSLPPTTPALEIGNTMIEWDGGLRWLTTNLSPAQIRTVAAQYGGHATLYRYTEKPDDITVFHPLQSTVETINRRMMQRIDPFNVFNPGRLLPNVQG